MKQKSKEAEVSLAEKKRLWNIKMTKQIMARKVSQRDLARIRNDFKENLESGLDRTLQDDMEDAMDKEPLDDEIQKLPPVQPKMPKENELNHDAGISADAEADEEEALYLQKIKDIRLAKAKKQAQSSAAGDLVGLLKATSDSLVSQGCEPLVAAILTLAYVMAENGRLTRSTLLNNTNLHGSRG